jgi:hypothetical protein
VFIKVKNFTKNYVSKVTETDIPQDSDKGTTSSKKEKFTIGKE